MHHLQTSLVALQNGYADAKQRLSDDRGAALAEYGLLLALVALAAIGILLAFGTSLVGVFTEAEEELRTRPSVGG